MKEIINEILKYWEENLIEKQVLETDPDIPKNRSKDEYPLVFNFYDGPPFASGSPHYGHLLASSIKDVIPRYMYMRGYYVPRKWGWDCHGLPAEQAVEKKLGVHGRKQIEEFGIEKFVEEARNYVSNVNDEWERFVKNLGRWVDFKRAYFTMDLDFMESVISVFKNLYNKNLIYKSYKISAYCPNCGTPLSGYEVSQGYAQKQDKAITVKFRNSKVIEVVAALIKKENKYLLLYQNEKGIWITPGGKVENGESLIDALKREIKEEINVDIKNYDYRGYIYKIVNGVVYKINYFDVEINGEIELNEKIKHSKYSFAYKDNGKVYIENLIIEDNIQREFFDLYILDFLNKNNEGDLYYLAWTTTPWTLTANMFLAVNPDIIYVLIYDKDSKSYYVLAKSALDRYKGNYFIIDEFSGKNLIGINYEPIFNNPKGVYTILGGDFVTSDTGTGIVHIAPSFGEEDYNLVLSYGYDEKNAKEWIYMPLDDYCNFVEGEYRGEWVFNANEKIIKDLKDKGIVIKIESITHNYPHCRRCDTPLIYRAIDSYFVKIDVLKEKLLKNAEKINFIPEHVKNRFIKGIENAPDWNISRNRFWGAPIPIWSDGEKEIVIGSLEELFQYTKTGSKNIAKLILQRHAETDYNIKGWGDLLGKATLSDRGKKQAQNLVNYYKNHEIDIIVLSPLKRTLETIIPYLEFLGKDIEKIKKNYFDIHKIYVELIESKKLKDLLKEKLYIFEIDNNIYIDFRLTEIIVPIYQDKKFYCNNVEFNNEPIAGDKSCETAYEVYDRVKNCTLYWARGGLTTLFVSHGDPLVMIRKFLRGFDRSRKHDFYPSRGQFFIHYINTTYSKEVDLHRPYIESHWFMINGKKYEKLPLVLDCWFESGSMPFGQFHYLTNEL